LFQLGARALQVLEAMAAGKDCLGSARCPGETWNAVKQ
jgi:hypothetical protein